MPKQDKLKRLHDKGERDASKGNCCPPHGVFDDLTTWSDDGMKRNREENQAYNAGIRNVKKQKGER